MSRGCRQISSGRSPPADLLRQISSGRSPPADLLRQISSGRSAGRSPPGTRPSGGFNVELG
jgi:hypothetical protein